ncbi:MAG: hypothetical protein OXC26_02325, partial [Albidovulum sp.]|nr:hypothetical protein [Albidovulum sp.]
RGEKIAVAACRMDEARPFFEESLSAVARGSVLAALAMLIKEGPLNRAREPDYGIPRVRVIGTASNSGDAAVAGLLQELTRTRTVFPETGLRMVYELPVKAAEPNYGGRECSPP